MIGYHIAMIFNIKFDYNVNGSPSEPVCVGLTLRELSKITGLTPKKLYKSDKCLLSVDSPYENLVALVFAMLIISALAYLLGVY